MSTHVRRWLVTILMAGWVIPTAVGLSDTHVDRAVVTVEKRSGRDWCVLDVQVSAETTAPVSALLRVIENYETYPKLFSEVREVRVETEPGATLVTEKVVVSAVGIENINRFTIRLVRSTTVNPAGERIDWTQAWADGSIDSVSGSWILEEVGSPPSKTRVTYRSHSAVPQVIFGQDSLIRFFLGDKAKAIVEAVFKVVASR